MKLYDYLRMKENNFLFLFGIIILIKVINAQTNGYSKSFTLPNTNFYIVYSNSIVYFVINGGGGILTYFDGDAILSSDEEIDLISFGTYCNYNTIYLISAKHYIHVLSDEGNYHSTLSLDDIRGSKVFLMIPLKCDESNCYYTIGAKDNSNKLHLYLFVNKLQIFTNEIGYQIEIDGDSDNFNCHLLDLSSDDNIKINCFYQNNNSKKIISANYRINLLNITIEETSKKSEDNNQGKIIKSYLNNGQTALVCYSNEENNLDNFYCKKFDIINNVWSDKTIVFENCPQKYNSVKLDKIDDNSNEYYLYCFQASNKFKLVKLNSDFDIINSEENGVYYFSEDIFKNCERFSLLSLVKNYNNNLDYRFICTSSVVNYPVEKAELPTTVVQTQAKTTTPVMGTSLITSQLTKTTLITTQLAKTSLISTQLTKTSLITTQMTKTTSITSQLTKTSLFTSQLTKTTSITSQLTKTSLFTSQLTKTTSTTSPPTKTILTIPQTIKSSLIVSSMTEYNSDDEIPIIQKVSNQKKEDIINNLDNFMTEYTDGNIYEIFGNDYKIKISPINTNKHSNISSYIDFLNCENVLREKNTLSPSSILTVYQIEIDNSDDQSLVNKIGYAVYDENNTRLDLSVCNEETILINYQIKNVSLINLDKLNYYSEIGIDIFNSTGDFFNDICYPYSENNSDVILQDRIEDIYENYSVCDNNCKYNGINVTEGIIACECNVETNINTNVEKLQLNEIIIDTFTGSNIGILKCYNLVFNMTEKYKNIGFILFTILILLHVPILIQYFRFNIMFVQKFIYTEIKKFDYCIFSFNPIKKDKTKKVSIQSKEENFNNLKNKRKSQRIIERSSSNLNLNKNSISNQNNIYESKESNNVNNINDRKSIFQKKKSIKKSVVLIKYNVYSKNYINIHKSNKSVSSVNNLKSKKKIKKIKKNKIKFSPDKYYLIQMDANNTSRKEPPNSNVILDNYQYETAIKYDKRDFFRIFYICLLCKENILKLIMFKIPIFMRGLNMCLFIFIYSSDLALNTIFYSNEKISEKYHYQGYNLFYFSLVNNIIKALLSALISILLVSLFRLLIDSRVKYEAVFRKEEKKMRSNKNYKIDKATNNKILIEIAEISKKLRKKILIFLISEFTLMLFYFYFVTAFCEVYKQTQISWIIDCFISIIISIVTEVFISWVIAILYTVSIRYKIKIIYRIVLFLYHT